MKTPMQEFIHGLIKLGYIHSLEYGQSPNIQALIKDYLSKEKQAIIDAAAECSAFGGEQAIKIGKRYFNEKYNENS